MLKLIFLSLLFYNFVYSQQSILNENSKFRGRNSELLIVALDKHTYNFKRASINRKVSSCIKEHTPLSKYELESRAVGFVKSVEDYVNFLVSKDSTGLIGKYNFDKILYFKDFIFYIRNPVDYGNILLYDRCVGHLIYATRTEWWGEGYQIYPPEVPEEELHIINEKVANAPDSIFVFSQGINGDISFSGLDTLQHIKIVQDFADYPYKILVFLVNSQQGRVDTDYGEWIIVYYRSFPEYNKTIN